MAITHLPKEALELQLEKHELILREYEAKKRIAAGRIELAALRLRIKNSSQIHN